MTRMLTLAAMMSAVSFSAFAADVPLGTTQDVTNLYSYPNCSQNCPSPQYPQTLGQTVAHYLTQTLQRDGLDGQVTVSTVNGQVTAHYTRQATGQAYQTALPGFLAAGQKAWVATQKIKADGKWAADWAFLLPLGLAMVNNPTVELLHFPPDYTMTEQDYLGAKTTIRWAGLLELNGVPAKQTDAYQTIVDIAPIAAPASAGSAIESANVYGDYSDYAYSLLTQLVSLKGSKQGRPLVAMGSPVRTWTKTYLNATVSVDTVAVATLPNSGVSVPIIGSNHPSMIYYAAFNNDHSENFDAGMKVMRQDLIAACWQAKMGVTPTQDPYALQKSCSATWTADTYGVCMQLETTIYNKTQQQAQSVCGAGGSLTRLNEPSDADVALLEKH